MLEELEFKEREILQRIDRREREILSLIDRTDERGEANASTGKGIGGE